MTALGSAFGRYEIIGTLGQGGFAMVYRAGDPVLGREVALKALHTHLAANPEIHQRFLAEARALASLRHPNIATVYDVGETDGQPFFAMELVEGQSLANLLQSGQFCPLVQVLDWLQRLASAIDYLHGAGLVHRDIKAANIMLDRSGRVVLMDFGIARSLDHARFTQTGASLGTAEAMAPEQVRGGEVGPPADVYALGVLAYQLLAGQPPFVGDTATVLHAQVYEPPPSLEAMRPGLPAPAYAAVAWALAKEPSERPLSATAFAEAMQAPPTAGRSGAAHGSTPVPPRAPSGREPQPEGAHFGVLPIALAGSLLAVGMSIVALLAVLLTRGHSPSPVSPPLQGSNVVSGTSTASTPAVQPATASPVPVSIAAPPVAPDVSAQSPASAQNPPPPQGQLVVTEKYGAALRDTPSSDAHIITIVACSTRLQALSESSGWFSVEANLGPAGSFQAWVGGARVASSGAVAPPDCSGALTFEPGEQVLTQVPTGCLSLRSTPSSSAPFSQCVSNGHVYTILNGPVSGDDEDWFEVTSPSTGSGWVVAQYLLPSR